MIKVLEEETATRRKNKKAKKKSKLDLVKRLTNLKIF